MKNRIQCPKSEDYGKMYSKKSYRMGPDVAEIKKDAEIGVLLCVYRVRLDPAVLLGEADRFDPAFDL
jgi:hypothetical protein